jgi:hypothetical protein
MNASQVAFLSISTPNLSLGFVIERRVSPVPTGALGWEWMSHPRSFASRRTTEVRAQTMRRRSSMSSSSTSMSARSACFRAESVNRAVVTTMARSHS